MYKRQTFDTARIDDYDAIVLPGGVVNADTIRLDEMAVELVKDAAKANKPIAVICHGAWILATADLLKVCYTEPANLYLTQAAARGVAVHAL